MNSPAKTNAQVSRERAKKEVLYKAVNDLTKEATALRANGWNDLAKQTENKLARIKRKAAVLEL